MHEKKHLSIIEKQEIKIDYFWFEIDFKVSTYTGKLIFEVLEYYEV